MNSERIKGNWNQTKGSIKERWGRLTDDELMQIDGMRDRLVGRIQETYGIAKEQAEQEVRDFENLTVS
jgi:uncharacterized protein YjbJ (UPF0337 family)